MSKQVVKVELAGEVFKQVAGTMPRYAGRTIYDVYGRPSERKIGIWEDWCRWSRELEKQPNVLEVRLWVSSYNSNVFTIGGEIVFSEGSRYIYITKTRQEIA